MMDCKHKRYTVDVAEQTGRCMDCGAEGRMQFVVGDPVAAERERCAKLGAWLPIATAPRDGSWVLLAGGTCPGESDDDKRPVSGQWTNYLNGMRQTEHGRWQFAWYEGGYYGEYRAPTHWQPLPAQLGSIWWRTNHADKT